MKTSFQQRVLDAVLASGRRSIKQLVADVGKYVSTATATKIGRGIAAADARRGRSIRNLAPVGRYKAVFKALRNLVASGKLVKVRPGVYSVPPPRIHIGEAHSA